MWACRSLLRRSIPLATSHLRPDRRKHATHAAVLRKSSRGYSVTDAANEPDSHADSPVSPTSRLESDLLGPDQVRQLDRTAKLAAATKRHLYLVLDDHEDEYGIYKLDLDADRDTDSAQPHLEPAVIRLEVPAPQYNCDYGYAQSQFAAVGSCIVTTGAGCAGSQAENAATLTQGHAMTFVYDTKTAALSAACDLPEDLSDGFELAVAVGNRLYVLESESERGGLECMTTDRGEADEDEKRWRPFSGSSRCFWRHYGFRAPFRGLDARAHAVHPRGRAFFVSFVAKWSEDADGTFSFDTVSNTWTRVGGWQLPFKGHAGYDSELDAWIGLHAVPDDDDEDAPRLDGFLCACPVPSSDRAPEWKVGREKMLILDDHAEWMHVDAKLVRMGDRGEYCLIERLRRREGAEESLRSGDRYLRCLTVSRREECLLRLTTFRVGYGDDGELIVATAHRRARSYTVPRYRMFFEAQAFWI